MTPFQTTFSLIKKPWFILGFIILLTLSYFYLDKPIATYFHNLDLRTKAPWLYIITTFGKSTIYALLFLSTALYGRYLKPNKRLETYSWFLLGCLVLSYSLGFVLKLCLSRARPELLFSMGAFGFYGFKLSDLWWSFPSGHAITSVSIACGLGILFPRYFYVFLSLALVVMASRVLLFFHYLSDVLAGCYLSILVVGFFAQYVTKNYPQFALPGSANKAII